MRQVYRALPIVRTSAQLGWSHYLALLKSPPAQRAHYAERAAKESLSVRQLQEAINAGVSQLSTENTERPQTPTLQPRRGVLHAYRLVESRSAVGTVELALDLGFSLRRVVDLAGIAQAAPGRVVASVRKGRGYALKSAELTRSRLFTFVAVVDKVVDGDTLLVEVDCGFSCRMRQRLRLRGIDAPELKTARGQSARSFVNNELAAVDFVVIKTFRPDKYDRYLADVFFLPGAADAQQVAAEGIYLNALLLKKGLAQVFS